MSRHRAFCFTCPNYTDEEIGVLSALEPKLKYLVYGKEVAASGLRHLQGYIVFATARSELSVRALLRGHWELARGSAAENRVYCTKDGDFYEFGNPPLTALEKGESEKERWSEILRLSEEADWDALREKHPQVYVTRLSGLEKVHKKRKIVLSTLQGELSDCNLWIVGKTGSGKSRYARELYPSAYVKDPQSIWWDDYDQQDVVIVDDFDKFQVKQGGDMKRMLDRYPFQAQHKGGMALIRPQKVIITSQYHPSEIWDDDKTVDAIMRRVKILDMDNPFNAHLRTFRAPAPAALPVIPTPPADDSPGFTDWLSPRRVSTPRRIEF